ncbi:MAG: hypothetical protein KGL39_05325 [Patescibacteria group bacterium]|nr:hypothetical protein [Patescibacteria group bacterium]
MTPEEVERTFKALGFALSGRAILLTALVGAFAIAVMAMIWPSYFSLEILVAYGIFAVIPVAYLEVRRRQ